MSIYVQKNERTKQLIRSSFMQILEEKSFEAITIGDITKQAGISRGTFYLHYMDKYDLLEKMEQQLFVDLGNHIDLLQSHYLSDHTFKEDQEHLAELLFSFIEKRAHQIRIYLGDHGRAGFHLRFRDAFTQKVRANLLMHESFTADLTVPLDYFLSFITSAFLGLIEQWIQNGLDKTPQQMTGLYMAIISFIQKK